MPKPILTVAAILVFTPPALSEDPPKRPSDAPKAPPQTPVDSKAVPPALADWTPRPATGKAEPWEKATDKDWVDPRFRAMNTGPFLDCTMRYPNGKRSETVYKATAIRLTTPANGGGGSVAGGIVFDRNTMRIATGWAGDYLNISDQRFGLMNTPTPKGDVMFSSPAGPGWADGGGKWDIGAKRFTAPLPKEWAKYRGLYLHGDRVVLKYKVGGFEVLESPKIATAGAVTVLVRSMNVHGAVEGSTLFAGRLANDGGGIRRFGERAIFEHAISDAATIEAVGVTDESLNWTCVRDANGDILVRNKAYLGGYRTFVVYARFSEKETDTFHSIVKKLGQGEDLSPFTQPGPARWGQPLVTDLIPGDDSGPFAVDTLTIPYENPHKALFFCTGLDFLPDGRIAVCTAHGDVWLVRVDEKARKCYWQRFATGLYQPLGLKVVDGKVVVLERGQLTRLHDNNGDGEADFYECINNDWHTGGGEHSYDTCLETDPAGNFYFFKTGDTETPTGGCLLKVSKDGSKSEIFCTGFRHPIGLGISPTGIITGADQEGNWMPATRIDQYRPGGFYGDMRAHHRSVPPKLYDSPLCWLPREVDNSAGGQVWVPENSPWPLSGLPLHLSYGRCKAFLLLRQPTGDVIQGGATDLHMTFLSGVCRGRFNPTDGHLYTCGLNGWQTAAKADGSLQRARYTGRPLDVPVKMEVVPSGIKLTFSRPLDRAKAADPANYRAAWWNYHWSGEYGSKRYKLSTGGEGQDEVLVQAVDVTADGQTVVVKVGPIRPVMQMQVGYNVAAADGKPIVGSVYLTVNRAP
jgi:hypothetical protein